MKHLITILLFVFVTFSQELKYSETISIEITKSESFDRAKLWLAETYKNSKEVIQHEDKDNGVILGRGASRYIPGYLDKNFKYFTAMKFYNGFVYYTVKLSFADGKYKVEFYNFKHVASSHKGISLGKIQIGNRYKSDSNIFKVINDIHRQIEREITALYKDMKLFIGETNKEFKNSFDA